MRNLKRALSMLLSSTMVLGMVAMGGSAAGYQDVDDSYNKEAIEVLQAVGIMTGVDDAGNFDPDATVTRNQMAVIMSNLMAYNVATYKGTSPFTDVPEWAEPYVAACWTNGITAGIGDTLYGGDQEVTTSQAALMIMKALGYFQYQSDFGSDWQLSTVTQGNKIDLFEDVDSGVKEAMSRNDVAQLVLNGLEAGTVEAETNGTITVGDTTIVSGVKYNYITSGQDYAKSIDNQLYTSIDGSNTQGSIVQLGEKLYMGSLRKDQTVLTNGDLNFYTDVFGRPSTRWEYQSKEIGVYAEDADYAFSDKVTAKKLYDAVGRTAAENYVWTITIDGAEVYQEEGFAALVNNKTDTVKEVMDLTLGLANGTGNGVRTEVFVDAVNGYVHMSLTHYYAAEVYTVDEDNGVTTLADLGNGPAALDDEFDTTDFEDDQVVVYSFTNGEIQEIYAATSMEGTVTATRVETDDNNGDYYIVDGTKYNYNWSVPAADRLETENVNNNMVGYLDQYGYAIYIDEAAVSYDYAYVLSMGNDGDIYGGNADTWYARLVLTDGTVVKAETDEDDDTLNNHIVSYTVDKNGVYSLSDRSSGKALEEIANIDVDNGIASFEINGKNYTANSSTVFIIGDSAKDEFDYNNYDFTAYTGVKSMPNITNGTNDKFVIATADNSNVAKVVYVQDADVSGAGSVYFVRANVEAKLVNDSELGRYREIDAVVDGEVTTLKVKEGTTAEEILCGGLANQVNTLTQLTPAQGLYLNDAGTQRIVALESITTNADGLVTNVRLYDARNAQGDGFVNFYAEGTDKATKETVMLGGTEDTTPGTRYAWYDDVAVVRWDTYAGEFKVSTINSVKTDLNDRAVAVLADDVLNGLCIVEYKSGATLPAIPQQDVVVDMEDANFTATFDGLDEGDTIADAQAGNQVQVVIKTAALKSRASGDPVTTLEAGVQYSVKINGVDYGPYTVNENGELAFTYTLTDEDIAAGEVVINGVYTYVEDEVDPSEPISSVAITVTAPTKVGETLAAPKAGTGVAVTGTWAPNTTTAVAGENTLTIAIAAAEGYTLADNYTVTVNGKDATVTDGKVTVSYTVTEEPSTSEITKVTVDGTSPDYLFTVGYNNAKPDDADVIAEINKALGAETVKELYSADSKVYALDESGKSIGEVQMVGTFNVSVNGTVVGTIKSDAASTVNIDNVKVPADTTNKLIVDGTGNIASGSAAATVTSPDVLGNSKIAIDVTKIADFDKLNGELKLVNGYAVSVDSGSSVTLKSYTLPGSAEKKVPTSTNLFPMGTTFEVEGKVDKDNNSSNATNVILAVNGEKYGTSKTVGDKVQTYTYTMSANEFTETKPDSFELSEVATTVSKVMIDGKVYEFDNVTTTAFKVDHNSALNGDYLLLMADGDNLDLPAVDDLDADLVKIDDSMGDDGKMTSISGLAAGAFAIEGVADYILVPVVEKTVTVGTGIKYAVTLQINGKTYNTDTSSMETGNGSTAYYFAEGATLVMQDTAATAGYRITKAVGAGKAEVIATIAADKVDTAATPYDVGSDNDNVVFAEEKALGATDLALASVGSLTTSSKHSNVATNITGTNFTADASTPDATLAAGNNTVTITLTANTGFFFAAGSKVTPNASDASTVTNVTTKVAADGKTATITLSLTGIA